MIHTIRTTQKIKIFTKNLVALFILNCTPPQKSTQMHQINQFLLLLSTSFLRDMLLLDSDGI